MRTTLRHHPQLEQLEPRLAMSVLGAASTGQSVAVLDPSLGVPDGSQAGGQPGLASSANLISSNLPTGGAIQASLAALAQTWLANWRQQLNAASSPIEVSYLNGLRSASTWLAPRPASTTTNPGTVSPATLTSTIGSTMLPSGITLAQATALKNAAAGDQTYSFTYGGLQRSYIVHVPQGYDPTKAYPVVLVFHGGGGDATSVRQQSEMDLVSDQNGFLAVYPNGTGENGQLTWNDGSGYGYAAQHNVDDVGFVRTLILSDLPSHYRIDSQRVYATGFSNGAIFCYRLARECSDLIAAIAPVAGDMQGNDPAPPRAVPVIDFQGQEDTHDPYYGGIGTDALWRYPHQPIPTVIAWWAQADNCLPSPVATVTGNGYIETEYAPAPGTTGAPVVLYTLPDGGHTWPGGVNTTWFSDTGNLVQSVNASAIIWQFFSQFSLPGPAA